MKVIDLLVKIANGEDIPEKIKWEDIIYVYSEYDKDYLEYPFSNEEYKGLFNMKDSILTQYLNDEIEIIEEEPSEEEKKIPKKLTDILRVDDLIPPVDENMYKIWQQTIKNQNKINSIIDYLKSKGDE